MSHEDIKNHHTITETLNKLKLLVEEAELWVVKQVPRVEDTGGGKVRREEEGDMEGEEGGGKGRGKVRREEGR